MESSYIHLEGMGEYDDMAYDLANYSDGATHKCSISRRVNSTAEAANYLYSGYQLWTFRLIQPLILTIGMITNLAFLYVVARVQSMRTVVNQYLVHLAVADMLFLIGAIGKKLWQYCESPIRDDEGSALGPVMVIISHLLTYTNIFSSEILVTLVAFERFYAVCRPMVVFAASSNNRKVANILCLIWMLSLGLAATTLPATLEPYLICVIWPDDYKYLPDTWIKYGPMDEHAQVYAYVMQTVPFFVVMLINSVLYVCIMREMERRLLAMERHDLDLHTNVEIRNQVSRMLVANGVIFFVLMAPFQFGSLIMAIDRITGKRIEPQSLEQFLQVTRMMVYLNSAVNPIIYNVANSRYRAAFEEAFCKNQCLKRRSRRSPAKQLSNHSSVYATSITKASNSDSSLAGNTGNNGNETCV